MDGNRIVGGYNFRYMKCKVKMQHDMSVPHVAGNEEPKRECLIIWIRNWPDIMLPAKEEALFKEEVFNLFKKY